MADKKVERSFRAAGKGRLLSPTERMRVALSQNGIFNASEMARERGKQAHLGHQPAAMRRENPPKVAAPESGERKDERTE